MNNQIKTFQVLVQVALELPHLVQAARLVLAQWHLLAVLPLLLVLVPTHLVVILLEARHLVLVPILVQHLVLSQLQLDLEDLVQA